MRGAREQPNMFFFADDFSFKFDDVLDMIRQIAVYQLEEEVTEKGVVSVQFFSHRCDGSIVYLWY